MVNLVQPSAGLGTGAALQSRRFVLPARLGLLPEAREQFLAYLVEIGVSAMERDMLALGFTEALTNAIKHGCEGDDQRAITLEWWNDGTALTVAISHEGEGPPQELLEQAELPHDPLATSGRGLFLIRQLFDDCQLWRSTTSVRMELSKSLGELGQTAAEDDDLSQILEELSHSYESLAAFQRMGNALITDRRTGDFLEEGLRSLRQIHGSQEPDRLWLCLSEAVLDSVQQELAGVEGVRTWSELPDLVHDTIESGDSFLWSSKEAVREDPEFAEFSHGCIFPIMARGDSLGCLVVALRHDDHALEASILNNLRTFTDLFGIALANANMQKLRQNETRAVRELELAAEIQKMLLPVSDPLVSEDWSLCMQHRSAQEVAGDYLEARYDEQGNLLMTVIDVMGKGVSAAMLASVYRTAFLMNLSKVQSLDDMARSLNQVLASQLGELSMFVTCALVRIDAGMTTMEIVNAGHCPVLRFNREGLVEQIEASGPPLGIFEDSDYTVETRDLIDDEAVLLVTDGLFEWQYEGAWWGWDRLVELASQRAFHDPLGLWNDIQGRIGAADGELEDDQTLLFWRRRAPKSSAKHKSPAPIINTTASP